MIYIILIVYLLIALLVCAGRYLDFQQNRRLFLILAYIPLVLIMGLRGDGVGVDTLNYVNVYNNITSHSYFELITNGWNITYVETGYSLFVKTLSIIYDSVYFVRLIEAVIINALFLRFFSKNSKNIFFSISLYLGLGIYLFNFNITRQMLAIAIVVNTWDLIKQNKVMKSFVLLAIATTFHNSSIVFIVAYIIYLFRNNKAVMRLLPLVIIVVGINYRTIIGFLQSHVSRFNNYYSNWRNGAEANLVRIIWLIILLLATYLIYKKQKAINNNSSIATEIDVSNRIDDSVIIGIFSIIYVATQFIGIYFNYFDRVGLFFAPFVVLLFERFGYDIKSVGMARVYFSITWCCFMLYFLLSTTSSQYQYSFFF